MNIELYITPTKADTWIAATAKSPYFCFEAGSREGVIELASQAARFYSANQDAIARVRSDKEREDIIPILNKSQKELVTV
jgi:hypothetical protein